MYTDRPLYPQGKILVLSSNEKSLTNGSIIDRIAFASGIVGYLDGVSDNKIWRHSQGVRQGSATPVSPVQIWVAPRVVRCHGA